MSLFRKWVALVKDKPVLKVRKLDYESDLHYDFDDTPWDLIDPELIDFHMGEEPVHRPLTQFKICYDPSGISLVFRVIDKFVRAVAEEYQGQVYKDSCVEFFFSPNAHVEHGYFNLEVNCCGKALFEFHPPNGGEMIRISADEFREISIVHHLKGRIDPEIRSAVVWAVACRIPFGILERYCQVTIPAPGRSWRANFHKCADLSSHPHWLTWAHVDHPVPRFHLPEFFGVLEFE